MKLYVGFNSYECKPMTEKQWRNRNRKHIAIGMANKNEFHDIYEVAGSFYYDKEEIEI